MNTSKLSLVPLQQASLCLDCDMITSAHTHCFACGSVALLNLARTLNGGEDSSQVVGSHAAVTSISDRRTIEMPALCGTQAQWPRRLGGECVPFPHTYSTLGTETQKARPWHSFREVAAVVHRALTIAVIGILVRGGSTQAWGQTPERYANASNGRTQAYGHTSAEPCGW